MLGVCWAHVGPCWAQVWQLSRFWVPLKQRGKTEDSRAILASPSYSLIAIAIASGSCVPTKNASAPSVRADFLDVVAVADFARSSKHPCPGSFMATTSVAVTASTGRNPSQPETSASAAHAGHASSKSIESVDQWAAWPIWPIWPIWPTCTRPTRPTRPTWLAWPAWSCASCASAWSCARTSWRAWRAKGAKASKSTGPYTPPNASAESANAAFNSCAEITSGSVTNADKISWYASADTTTNYAIHTFLPLHTFLYTNCNYCNNTNHAADRADTGCTASNRPGTCTFCNCLPPCTATWRKNTKDLWHLITT